MTAYLSAIANLADGDAIPEPWVDGVTNNFNALIAERVVVTALPTGALDGQTCVLVDSTTAPTWAWEMIYVAAFSKWVCVGGSPATSEVATSESTTSTSYVDLSTVGPSFTIPFTGTYIARFGCGHTCSSGSDNARMSIKLGSATALDSDSTADYAGVGSDGGMWMEVRRAATAADVWKTQYKTRAGGTHAFWNRRLQVMPVSLG